MTVSIPPPAAGPDWLAEIQPAMRDAPPSGIVEVFNYGRGRQGLIPLWVGEGDRPTPPFIADAAKASLDRGETFYADQRGIPDLREAIARYMTRVYGAKPGGGAFAPDRFFVTVGGMHALQIAAKMTVASGEEALIPSPAWPNFAGAIRLAGAKPVFVPLERGETRWRLDPERLAAAVTPATRVDLRQFARQSDRLRRHPRGARRGAGDRAPPQPVDRRRRNLRPADFLRRPRAVLPRRHGAGRQDPVRPDAVEELGDDRLAHRLAGGAAGFVAGDREHRPVHHLRRAGVRPARCGGGARRRRGLHRRPGRAHARRARHRLPDGLAATGRVRFARPDATFYLFCAVDGEPDSRALALRLVDEAGVGVAPGSAFGPGGEGYLRLCFGRAPDEIAEATRRLARWLAR